MSTEVKVTRLPDCDMKHAEPVKALYDGKTKFGPWGYMCEEHFEALGVGLGTGRGQRLVLIEAEKKSVSDEEVLALRAAEDEEGS